MAPLRWDASAKKKFTSYSIDKTDPFPHHKFLSTPLRIGRLPFIHKKHPINTVEYSNCTFYQRTEWKLNKNKPRSSSEQFTLMFLAPVLVCGSVRLQIPATGGRHLLPKWRHLLPKLSHRVFIGPRVCPRTNGSYRRPPSLFDPVWPDTNPRRRSWQPFDLLFFEPTKLLKPINFH